MGNSRARFHGKFFSHIVFLSPVFKSLALSPLFSLSPPFCYFTWRCRCERVRPWKNIWFRKLVMKESIDWPLHLGTQWQMDLQFSAWLSGNKAHFHFHREAVRVQSSSIRLFNQAARLTHIFTLAFAALLLKIDNHSCYDLSRQTCSSASLASLSEVMCRWKGGLFFLHHIFMTSPKCHLLHLM